MAKTSRNTDTLQRLSINSWKDGEVSSFYASRVPDSGLAVAQDTIVEQNGTASDRGSFLREEIDELPYPLISNIYVYKLADNSESLICMLNSSSTPPPTPEYAFPSAVGTNNTWGNAVNAYKEDGIYTSNVLTGIQDFKDFNLSIPNNATILGIEVTSYGSGSVSPAGQFGVELSWNGGTNTTTTNSYHDHTGGPNYSYGIPASNTGTELWGRIWTPSEFSNSNFVVRCTHTQGTFMLDSIKVKVVYSVPNTEGLVYILNGTNWVRHDEILFDSGYNASFVQISDKVVIFNDKDAFSYYDITNDKIKRFAEVTDPASALTAVKSGLSGTNFTIYYRFTYTGNGGETALSPAYSADISALRENWTSSDYFTITRPEVTDDDAIDWNLFMVLVPNGSGTPTWSDYECIKENIPLSTNIIVDNGKLQANTIRTAPESNTTAGIIAKYGVNINGRLWALHNHTVYWGGDSGNELIFGGSKGSGYHNIDQYGSELPMAIQLGRDNSGTSCINLLTAGIAGKGSIYDIYYNSITVNNTVIPAWEFKQREGNDGTNAPFSVIHANNNLYYLSLDGFKSTGVKPNIVGIQSTDIISNAIKDKVQLLTESDLKTCYSVYYDEKILWTVSYGSQTNNQIWVYDILHGGIWSRWNINTDGLFIWTKSGSDSVKLYIVKDKKILFYQPNSIIHQDDGETFTSILESGTLRFKEDGREWAYLLQVLFVLLKPIGKIHFSITAHTKKGNITKDDVVDFGGINETIGWNAISTDTVINGSHNNKIHNTVYGKYSMIIPKDWIEVSLRYRKMIQYFSWKIWIEDKYSSCMLSQVVPEYTDIGMGVDMLTRSDTIRI